MPSFTRMWQQDFTSSVAAPFSSFSFMAIASQGVVQPYLDIWRLDFSQCLSKPFFSIKTGAFITSGDKLFQACVILFKKSIDLYFDGALTLTGYVYVHMYTIHFLYFLRLGARMGMLLGHILFGKSCRFLSCRFFLP